ncbi:hypothetical protein G3N55_08600 [Dissulfurirhabdus thermomarina]|uniref:Uncharacterized protein n=1 Tax=Dissulfurirhabdus thermomarina TaxID=1765737 RepID=A0A6N9TPB6_DISTH|nr:hypothetical protein [Dissulfurirhabdus thermomarina]NDY42898.1 hypothetical protein [Dissulfurirhabdus thermomarina]NMX24135.1 hypothetical protein [Dissulfurirhabdus thermomarina]
MTAIDWQTLLSLVLILAGAGVLCAGLFKLRELFDAVSYVAEGRRRGVTRFLQAFRVLVVFFLAGYLAVALAFAREHLILGKVFVSLVFFLGAVFVFLALVLHARMLAEFKSTLHGLVPICMRCKKIRLEAADPADPASWTEIESYVSKRTEARFSHGLCPDCLEEMRRQIPGR